MTVAFSSLNHLAQRNLGVRGGTRNPPWFYLALSLVTTYYILYAWGIKGKRQESGVKEYR